MRRNDDVMNPEASRFLENPTPKNDPPPLKKGEKPKDYDFLTMTVGTKAVINGVPCVLHHINRGKRRLTFTPADAKQMLPVEAMKDPVQTVVRKVLRRG